MSFTHFAQNEHLHCGKLGLENFTLEFDSLFVDARVGAESLVEPRRAGIFAVSTRALKQDSLKVSL